MAKRLFIRLSSLGDVIISTAALEVAGSDSSETHFLTAPPCHELLKGHPRINRLWVFDRQSGLSGWTRLCRQLFEQDFDEVVDLHGTIRTTIAHGLFFYWGVTSGRRAPRWNPYPKYRMALWGMYLLKAWWPKNWQPPSKHSIAARQAGGRGDERPNLQHLLKASEKLGDLPERYWVWIPSSRWPAKEWPQKNVVEMIRNIPAQVVLVGTPDDQLSLRIAAELREKKISYFDGIGKFNLRQMAQVLSRAERVISVDSGLAHLTEAIGKPVTVLFGPTVPQMGFGPQKKESRVLGQDLWCRPCGKDGRYCFRVTKRYKCLSQLQIRLEQL